MDLRLLSSILILLSLSCIDPFKPDFTDTPVQSLLVVEGLINNENKRQQIILSRSVPVSVNTGFFRESGANVTIKDDEDNCYQLQEETAGFYYTNPDDFQGEIGKSYQLHIELNSGEEYYSNFQEMLPVTTIDSTWYLLEEETFLIGDFVRTIRALNIYEAISNPDEPSFTQYSYEGTYETESPLQGSSVCWREPSQVPQDISDTLKCYIDENERLPLNIFAKDMNNLTIPGNSLKIFTVRSNRRFEFGYSMVIKKSAITADYFNFMNEVKSQGAYGGGLFDPPPTEIRGNIVSAKNPDNRALGFFGTSVSTTKRIFISGVEVIEDTEGLNCEYDASTIPPEIPPFTSCCDCRLYANSTDIKPDFWPQ